MKKLFFTISSFFIAITFTGATSSIINTPRAHAASISTWWPTEGAHMQGTQPFKALLDGGDITAYDLYWQVDGGGLNQMYNSWANYPHKEASVDLTNWSWHGAGPYAVTFVAKQNGATVAQTTVHIYNDGASAQTPAAIVTSQPTTNAPQPVTTTSTTVSTPPTATTAKVPSTPVSSGSGFYIDPNSNAANQANAWSASRPSDAAKMQLLANQPTAKWFGDWSGDIKSAVSSYVNAANGKTAVMVAYDIPQRDCGGYSAGGSSNYLSWISSFAAGIGSGNAIVILEPDSLAQISCLSSADQATRLSLLSQAVTLLKQHPNTKVYLDAGHSGWVDAGTMAGLLSKANVQNADGFSLNVSNYNATSLEESYGQNVSSKVGGKHFVIDTSRNGNGSNGQWCNASGAAIGSYPTLSTGNGLTDSFLWIKTPGESDGTCNGGPSAGTWWADYALSLVNNAHR